MSLEDLHAARRGDVLKIRMSVTKDRFEWLAYDVEKAHYVKGTDVRRIDMKSQVTGEEHVLQVYPNGTVALATPISTVDVHRQARIKKR